MWALTFLFKLSKSKSVLVAIYMTFILLLYDNYWLIHLFWVFLKYFWALTVSFFLLLLQREDKWVLIFAFYFTVNLVENLKLSVSVLNSLNCRIRFSKPTHFIFGSFVSVQFVQNRERVHPDGSQHWDNTFNELITIFYAHFV